MPTLEAIAASRKSGHDDLISSRVAQRKQRRFTRADSIFIYTKVHLIIYMYVESY